MGKTRISYGGLWAITGFLVVLGLAMLIGADRAECAWCPSINCYGAGGCGPECVCVIPPSQMVGSCFSIE